MYTCNNCGERFLNGWAERGANDVDLQTERSNRARSGAFPVDWSNAEIAQLCDPCYQKLMKWFEGTTEIRRFNGLVKSGTGMVDGSSPSPATNTKTASAAG